VSDLGAEGEVEAFRKKKCTIYLPADLLADFKVRVMREGKTMSEKIEELIEAYLKGGGSAGLYFREVMAKRYLGEIERSIKEIEETVERLSKMSDEELRECAMDIEPELNRIERILMDLMNYEKRSYHTELTGKLAKKCRDLAFKLMDLLERAGGEIDHFSGWDNGVERLQVGDRVRDQ